MKIVGVLIVALIAVVFGDSFHHDPVNLGYEYIDSGISQISGILGNCLSDSMEAGCPGGARLYQDLNEADSQACIQSNRAEFNLGDGKRVEFAERTVSERAVVNNVATFSEYLVGFPTDHTFMHVECNFNANLELMEQVCAETNHIRFTVSVHDQLTRTLEESEMIPDLETDDLRICGDSAEVLISAGEYRGLVGGAGNINTTFTLGNSGCIDGSSAYPGPLASPNSDHYDLVDLTDYSATQFLCPLNTRGEYKFRLQVEEIQSSSLNNQNLFVEFSCTFRSYKAYVLSMYDSTDSI